MKPRTIAVVGLVIAAGLGLVVFAMIRQPPLHPAAPLFWVAISLLIELFWVPALAGHSVHSLGATVKLAAINAAFEAIERGLRPA